MVISDERMDKEVTDDEGGQQAWSDELEALNAKVKRRLALLDKLKQHDLHTAAWLGQTRLVKAHIEVAAQHAAGAARKDLCAARRALQALEAEAAMKTARKEDDVAEADEYEIAVAYDEKLEEAHEAVAAAEETMHAIRAKAAEEAANAVDETEFGEGYRPLHYAAYAGHVDTVRLLLEYGARVEAKNEAQCTALFLGAQQGNSEVVETLVSRANNSGWCDARNLVPACDGRALCALDVARACDRTSERAKTRSALLGALRNGRNGGRPAKPSAPELVANDGPAGGLEVRWLVESSAGVPPTHDVKVKVVASEDRADASVVVVRADARRVRFPARFADAGRLCPGRAYAATIAGVNGVGAGEYSEPSPEVIALARTPPRRPPVPEEGNEEKEMKETPARRVDPKIQRARNAVREGREKRQRISHLMKAQAEHAAKKSNHRCHRDFDLEEKPGEIIKDAPRVDLEETADESVIGD